MPLLTKPTNTRASAAKDKIVDAAGSSDPFSKLLPDGTNTFRKALRTALASRRQPAFSRGQSTGGGIPRPTKSPNDSTPPAGGGGVSRYTAPDFGPSGGGLLGPGGGGSNPYSGLPGEDYGQNPYLTPHLRDKYKFSGN